MTEHDARTYPYFIKNGGFTLIYSVSKEDFAVLWAQELESSRRLTC